MKQHKMNSANPPQRVTQNDIRMPVRNPFGRKELRLAHWKCKTAKECEGVACCTSRRVTSKLEQAQRGSGSKASRGDLSDL
jgi:hypothetical protein